MSCSGCKKRYQTQNEIFVKSDRIAKITLLTIILVIGLITGLFIYLI